MADQTFNKLTQRIIVSLVSNRSVSGEIGSSGNISLRFRRNPVLKLLLNKNLAMCQEKFRPINIGTIRLKTLDYLESMRIKSYPYGRYVYSALQEKPILYASVYAVLTRSLYDDLELSEKQRMEWVDYIQHHQAEDGLFKDPIVANRLADTADWWGWRHLTLHVIMALNAFGAVPKKKFKFLTKFRNKSFIANWLESRDWKNDSANVSNEIQNYGTLLQYARDFQGEGWARDAVSYLLDGLDNLRDSSTGLWGRCFNTPVSLSTGIQTAYHLWLLYLYDRRPILNTQQMIDKCLLTQNKLGGFGFPFDSSACEDIDSIDPLARLYSVSSYRRDEIQSAMKRALLWTLANMNADGGFVFRRFEPFLYGHESLFSGINQSALFPTWFRTLSMAYISKILPDSFVGKLRWKFLNCPGHQFWYE
jgi:hypothetical protein